MWLLRSGWPAPSRSARRARGHGDMRLGGSETGREAALTPPLIARGEKLVRRPHRTLREAGRCSPAARPEEAGTFLWTAVSLYSALYIQFTLEQRSWNCMGPLIPGFFFSINIQPALHTLRVLHLTNLRLKAIFLILNWGSAMWGLTYVICGFSLCRGQRPESPCCSQINYNWNILIVKPAPHIPTTISKNKNTWRRRQERLLWCFLRRL